MTRDERNELIEVGVKSAFKTIFSGVSHPSDFSQFRDGLEVLEQDFLKHSASVEKHLRHMSRSGDDMSEETALFRTRKLNALFTLSQIKQVFNGATVMTEEEQRDFDEASRVV